MPVLCDVEIAAGLRRAIIGGALSLTRAGDAIEDYLDLPIVQHGHQWLLERILALRANFSAYDATYVALAEELDAALLTGDKRLRRAVKTHTELLTLPT